MTLQTIILIQNVIYYVLSACAFSLVVFGCHFWYMCFFGDGVIWCCYDFWGVNFPWGWFWGLIFLGGGFLAIWVDSKLIPLS